MKNQALIITALLLLASPLNAYAYVGPGLGLGVVGTIIGILFSVVLALFALFWYPIKRAWGRKKHKKSSDNGLTDEKSGSK